MMELGIYEQLVNRLVLEKIRETNESEFYISQKTIDKSEAAQILSGYLTKVIKLALGNFSGEKSVENQVRISNELITLLINEFKDKDLEENLIETEARMLHSVLKKIDSGITNFEDYLSEITPYTGLSQSELFTGSNSGISMESEIKKEILSSNKIQFLVSFIKWTGIRIFAEELKQFTERGGQLQVITTSYMGATDPKAVEFLASLQNTEVKVSYNVKSERLHAKAYLFLRDTGFHTGYVGSSNMSRSALTNGLEWNVKLTSQEISHVLDKFQKTFETYWRDGEFETFVKAQHGEKLRTALRQEKTGDYATNNVHFDLNPFHFQLEVLEKLATERTVHQRNKNLIVAATGTGKTVISAFDYKQFRKTNSSSKLLFVAHRKEILQQAIQTYRAILKDNNFGELWVDGLSPTKYDYVFASVQSLGNQIHNLELTENYFDYIVIDEVHHISAKSYRPILQKFNPKILLGLTATPERMDGEDILKDFSNCIAAEIRLPEALNRRLLCPFQYFGISDSIDLSKVEWKNGKYNPSELTKLYTQNTLRIGEIVNNLEKYLVDKSNVRALGFCVSQEHAKYMSERFNEIGLKSDYLISGRTDSRESIQKSLRDKKINYLFVVDIFNEGIDIPEIDTVLFLRPTESLTIFLQQLGRGLRLSDEKDCLTVLDFVGNARPEYNFDSKFRALVGKTNTPIIKEIENEFPHLPNGCSIVLEKTAKEVILENIRNATRNNVAYLINKIRNFQHQTSLPLTLPNFLSFNQIPVPVIYKKHSWKRLCAMAGVIPEFNHKEEETIFKAIKNKWLVTRSYSYLSFIRKLAFNGFKINIKNLSEEEKKMCLMIHYDTHTVSKGFKNLEESIEALGKSEIMNQEIIELMDELLNEINFIEKEITLPYRQPLKMHSRYTRDQILCAFGLSTFEKKSSNREGVAENKELKTELLFIDLVKSEKDFSPTTLYNDYAINDLLFHWQSQNATRPDKGKGLTYIQQKEQGKIVLLFVRERNIDEYGNTMSYVFLGNADFVNSSGSKPMNVTWQLNEPIPAYLWKDSAKMSLG